MLRVCIAWKDSIVFFLLLSFSFLASADKENAGVENRLWIIQNFFSWKIEIDTFFVGFCRWSCSFLFPRNCECQCIFHPATSRCPQLRVGRWHNLMTSQSVVDNHFGDDDKFSHKCKRVAPRSFVIRILLTQSTLIKDGNWKEIRNVSIKSS